MAKTTTKKNEKVQEKTKVVDNKKVVENKNIKNNVPKRIEKPKNDEQILCRSCALGKLYYESIKTGLVCIWDGMGSEEYIDFGELITMKSSQSRFLIEPWIIIEDERAVKYLGLENLYKKMNDVEHIENIFKLSLDEIKNKIRFMPFGVKKLLGEKAMKMIQDGTLYDIRIIKILEDELHIELQKLDIEE